MKKYCGMLLLALLLVLFPTEKGSAEGMLGNKLNYVALGDSLAAGVTPYKELDNSYTDLLAREIHREEALASFNKGFAVPGYTTGDVLSDMQKDVHKRIIGSGFKEKTATVREAIRRADIITISAGANDMLHAVKVNKANHSLNFNKNNAAHMLNETGDNLVEIQMMIKALNPDAQIYVMGYYNPFPYLPKEAQPEISKLLDELNRNIHKSTIRCGTAFVPSSGVIATDYQKYIPNPKNIHLSLAGYTQVAGQFWKEVQPDVLFPEFRVKTNDYNGNLPGLSDVQRASIQGRNIVVEKLLRI